MGKTSCAFFMAANSKDGFVSFFEDVRAEDLSRKLYVVKSGPGCGKSTFIKTAAQKLHQDGLCEYIYCSSDPKSLDGAILHDGGIAILDGTSPHVTDPAFPGAEGGYIPSRPF